MWEIKTRYAHYLLVLLGYYFGLRQFAPVFGSVYGPDTLVRADYIVDAK